MAKDFINPPALPDWKDVFSQVVAVPGSAAKTIYISGQVSVDREKNLIAENDLRLQAIQAFQNLQSALVAAGATTKDVVKLNIYVKNYKPADGALITEALKKYFPQENLPTSTWLGVQSLAEERFLVEVDAVAVVE